MMTLQYRMHPKVADIVSSTFYEEFLTTPSAISRVRVRENPVLFVDVRGRREKQRFSFKNTQEVAAVLRIVQKERLKNPHQLVNVIALHKPQMFAIRKELDSRGMLDSGLVDVITVDSMQGREADVIVLSCVRTGTSIGFLSDAQRLNVALSRAREMLYIVGDHDTLERCGSFHLKLVLAHRHLKLAKV